jgi:hypothetical protein
MAADMFNPNPNFLILILAVLTLCGTLLSFAHLLELGRAREAQRLRTMMAQEGKKRREAEQLAITLHNIAVAHGLAAAPRPAPSDEAEDDG